MEKAIRIEQTGSADVLALVDVDLPPPGSGEVRIRHHAMTVNNIDLQQRAGTFPIKLPSGLGMEAAGIVEAVGPDVHNVAIGDRIVYISREPGCYATARNCPARSVFAVPDSIPLDRIAAVFSRGLLAWHFTRTVTQLSANDQILVYGPVGTVGGLITQLASAAGAQVIGAVQNAEDVESAIKAGCRQALQSNEPEFAERVRALTGGDGVSVVYDPIGQQTFEQSLSSLKPHGLMVAYGSVTGRVPPISIMQELGARGSLKLTFAMLKDFLTPQLMPKAVPGFIKMIQTGMVSVDIGECFSLDDTAAAHRHFESGKALGATLLRP